MKVAEFENKRQFRCLYVSPKLKEEELLLYVNKSSDVSALLTECKAKVRTQDHSLSLLCICNRNIFLHLFIINRQMPFHCSSFRPIFI